MGDMADLDGDMILNLEADKHLVEEEPTKVYTCTPTERAFLDELREKGKMDGNYLIFPSFKPYDGEGTQLDPSDFKSNLKDLVNDTKTKAD